MSALPFLSPTSPLLLVGCGRMGSALARGWAQAGFTHLTILSRHAPASGLAQFPHYDAYAAMQHKPGAVLFAVKPQAMRGVLLDYLPHYGTAIPLLTIAAGLPLSFYTDMMGDAAPVVRIMPNTPSAIGLGMSVCIGNSHCTNAVINLATQLMHAVGSVAWLDDENQMHAATALSGSGPAYLFYFAECLMSAGRAEGLPEALCDQLVRSTLHGAASMLVTDKTIISQLRDDVVSKGGTTEAALEILMNRTDGNFSHIIRNAIGAARLRSENFSKKL